MSFDEAVAGIAERLSGQEYVEVYGHHDADGIAAAAIIATAVLRNGGRFRVRITGEIDPSAISEPQSTVLCDLGSGIENLPEDVMVIDHHEPVFGGRYHANPGLHQIDGERELSAAGAAFCVASELGDNRDLAGLVMLGIIGDRQEVAGKNLEIFNEGLAEGLIETGKGIQIPGREPAEALIMAIHPYLDGISGDEAVVSGLLEASRGPSGTDQDLLTSLAVIRMGKRASLPAMMGIYGDLFGLAREVIPDAHTMAALVEACGKTGHGGLAVSLCLRSADGIPEAWEIASGHRLAAIGAIREALASDHDGFYKVNDLAVASDVADALAYDIERDSPVAVYAESGGLCHISARCPKKSGLDLGAVMREIARTCGGNGGGHTGRAGATIGCSEMSRFMNSWKEAT